METKASWDMSDWDKPYKDKYQIFVIDPGRIVAIMPLGADMCWAINAGIKEVSKEYLIKSITSVHEKIYEEGTHSAEVILIIEKKIVGQTC